MNASERTLARRIAHRAEQAALVSLSGISRLVPKRAAVPLGGFLGAVSWALAGRRRRIAIGNVERALGTERPPEELRPIARSAYNQFGRLLVEGLMFPRYSAADAGTLIRYSGLEHIRAAYASGRGVLLFSAHFGNWELVALMQGYLEMPLTMVTRPLDNPHLEKLLARRRSRSGNEIVHKRSSLRPMLGTLGTGGGVAIVIDQNVRDGSGIFVEFFGRKAATTPSLALLALRTGAAVVPVFAIPESDGSYRVEYLPEVAFEPTGDRKRDVAALTQQCTLLIEQYVRLYPGAWLWMHERWKTRPREERKKLAGAKKAAAS